MNTSFLQSSCFLFEVHWGETLPDVTASILSCAINSLFALTAVLGNGIVMLVIWKTRELHSPSFTLLFCLAASDLLVGLLGQPSFVAYNLAELLEDFTTYCNMRMIQFFCGWITSGVSLLTLSGVSIDRLLALTLHLRYKTIITVPRVLTATAGIWVFCSVAAILKFWLVNWSILPTSIAVVAISTTAACTFEIFRIARKHQRQITDEQNRIMTDIQCNMVDVHKCKKSAITILYIYGLMLSLYLPFLAVVALETVSGYTHSVKIAYEYTTTFVFINSSLNPVVYCWRMGQIKRAVKNYLNKPIFHEN